MKRFKLALALLGFALGLAGVALENRILIWAAIVALAGAVALRLWLNRVGREEGR